jgi:hypothetical protein
LDIFAAIRRASSLVSSLAADRRPPEIQVFVLCVTYNPLWSYLDVGEWGNIVLIVSVLAFDESVEAA